MVIKDWEVLTTGTKKKKEKASLGSDELKLG